MLTTTERFEAAESLLREGRHEEARHLLDEILAVMPDHIGALNARGVLHLNAGEVEDGERLIRQAESIEPEDPSVLANLSSLAQLHGDLASSVDYAERAWKTGGEETFAARRLAAVNLAAGQAPRAIEVLAVALAAQPDDPDLLVTLGEARLAVGDPTQALAILERVLELNEGHVEGLIALARLRCLLDDPETAVGHAKKAYLAAPRNPLAAMILAKAQHESGQLNTAAETAERLLAVQPDFAPGRHLLARIRVDQGLGATALADLARWIKAGHSASGGLLMLSDVMSAAGAWNELLALCDKVPAKAPEAEVFARSRAMALLSLGHVGDAWRILAKGAKSIFDDERPDVQRTCSVEPDADPLTAMVLARAVVEWSREKPVHMTSPDFLAPAFQRLAGHDRIEVGCEDTTTVSQSSPSLVQLAAQLWQTVQPAFEPYLQPRQEGIERWRTALADFPRPWIGFYFDARAPGLQIDHLRRATEGSAGSLISLQFDAARHQLRTWPDVIDAGVAVADLADLVDLVASLDRVIGPNGWPIHVAGALGMPGTVLLPANHAWYWHGDGETAFWYPSIIRIVKPSGPDWRDALTVLRKQLDQDASSPTPSGSISTNTLENAH